MSRYARRREPAVRRKQRIELSETNVPARLFVLGFALLVAVVAFGAAISEHFSVQPGWQEIEASSPKTTASQSFVLSCKIGERAPNQDLRAITATYTATLDAAYQALGNEEVDGVSNLYDLNRHPNADVAVEPLLYQAFELLNAADCRYVYLAPLLEQYDALFAAAYDEEAAAYDPARDAGAGEFAADIAAFAASSADVQVRLMGENTLRLEVSDGYLQYAAENEITTFVDLGILRNAFLCDAVADSMWAMDAAVYSDVVISSYDGYTRNLSSEDFSLNLFDLVDNQVLQVGTVNYSAPAALVTFRSFPVSASDQANYYVYADGTVRHPYLNADGIPQAACSELVVLSKSGSAAALAIASLPAYTGGSLDTLAADSYVTTQNGVMQVNGSDFQ